jgi:hypothetical protein
MEILRKGRRCKNARVPDTQFCQLHQQEEKPTEEDCLAILQVLTASGVSSLPMFDIAHRIHSVPAGNGRTEEYREFLRRSITLMRAQVELWEQDLIYEAVHSDGENPNEMAITDQGREFLALNDAKRAAI